MNNRLCPNRVETIGKEVPAVEIQYYDRDPRSDTDALPSPAEEERQATRRQTPLRYSVCKKLLLPRARTRGQGSYCGNETAIEVPDMTGNANDRFRAKSVPFVGNAATTKASPGT